MKFARNQKTAVDPRTDCQRDAHRPLAPQSATSAPAAKETLEALLHEKEVRALLGVSRSTLWRMAKRGVIKPIRISKNVVRYKPHEVAAFLNTGMIAMNASPDATPSRRRKQPEEDA
jgi:predicted DNA-binding transcriptional regulator AlpA